MSWWEQGHHEGTRNVGDGRGVVLYRPDGTRVELVRPIGFRVENEAQAKAEEVKR